MLDDKTRLICTTSFSARPLKVCYNVYAYRRNAGISCTIYRDQQVYLRPQSRNTSIVVNIMITSWVIQSQPISVFCSGFYWISYIIIIYPPMQYYCSCCSIKLLPPCTYNPRISIRITMYRMTGQTYYIIGTPRCLQSDIICKRYYKL